MLYALQTLESFSELPLHMQQDVCKVAWLQRYGTKVALINREIMDEIIDPGHEISPEDYCEINWCVVCSPLPKALILFITKIREFPYPIYDLTLNQ